MSVSSKTTTGALPPSSRWTRLTSLAALPATCMPARTEPVMEAIAGVGCSTISRPVSRSPHTTLKTPLGRISPMISAIRTVEAGVVSDGLEHHRVARGDRRGELPHGHHHRVVPRGDLGADADRLAADDRGHTLHVLAGRAALEHAGGAGEEADLVDHRRDLLAGGQPDRLAGVLALGRHQLLRARLEGVGDLQQRLLPLGRAWCRAMPGRRPRRRPWPRRHRRRRRAGRSRRPRRWPGSTTSVVPPVGGIAEFSVDVVAQRYGARSRHLSLFLSIV